MENHLHTSENPTLILSLIKQDLICNKLVLGLSALGLEAGKYHLDIATVVLTMLGLDATNDKLMMDYFEKLDKVTGVEDVEDTKRIEAMAAEMYHWLLSEKQKAGEV